MAAVHRRVMLKTIAADAAHERLQPGHAYNRPSAEGGERVVCELTVAHVRPDHTGSVIRAYSSEGDGTSGCASLKRADGILLTKHGAENRRCRHPDVRQEVFGPVAAMEEN